MAVALSTTKRKTRVETVDFSPAAVGTDETRALFAISKGERVTKSSYLVLIASAAASAVTMTLGDGTDPDGYLVSFDPETATTATSTGALHTAAGEGFLYTADDTIDVVYDQTTPGAVNPKVQFQVTIEQVTP